MLSNDEIYALLAEAFSETQKGSEIIHEFDRDKQLLGEDGIFDSLDTMLFLDLVDEKLGKKLGRDIDLVDGDVFARENNPFANMGSMAEYIAERIGEE